VDAAGALADPQQPHQHRGHADDQHEQSHTLAS
jgi:hypothetical protein